MVVALSQSADPHLQLPPLFSDLPSVLLHGANGGREQLLDAAMQTIPVPFPSPLLVQASLPQIQGELSALLGLDPSVILQACAVMPEARNVLSLLQVLSAAMHNIPVVFALSQFAEPHLQLPSLFAEVPSVMLQDVIIGREQVLDAAVQTIPVP